MRSLLICSSVRIPTGVWDCWLNSLRLVLARAVRMSRRLLVNSSSKFLLCASACATGLLGSYVMSCCCSWLCARVAWASARSSRRALTSLARRPFWAFAFATVSSLSLLSLPMVSSSELSSCALPTDAFCRSCCPDRSSCTSLRSLITSCASSCLCNSSVPTDGAVGASTDSRDAGSDTRCTTLLCGGGAAAGGGACGPGLAARRLVGSLLPLADDWS
mmetsp:Transcript_35698/g.69942  ORF Transcript_35698/g.69942 Transcript_35698/m.69942 type:complete len:218 (+) Transcript_35698:392-1045(+)